MLVKSYKFRPRTLLLVLGVSLLAAGLSSCSQADESDFEPVTPPPLEIPPIEPSPVPDSETDVNSPAPDFYSPLPTAPTDESANPSLGTFEVTPTTPIPSESPATIPFSTGEPVIPPPSNGIQVTPQSPIQSAPAFSAPAAPVPAVPGAVPNVTPAIPNAAPGGAVTGNPGMYVPPPASTF